MVHWKPWPHTSIWPQAEQATQFGEFRIERSTVLVSPGRLAYHLVLDAAIRRISAWLAEHAELCRMPRYVFVVMQEGPQTKNAPVTKHEDLTLPKVALRIANLICAQPYVADGSCGALPSEHFT